MSFASLRPTTGPPMFSFSFGGPHRLGSPSEQIYRLGAWSDGSSKMSHTAQAFDNELDIIKREIATMGELTLEMLSSAVESLSSGSAGQAYEIISRDQRIEQPQRSGEGAEG